MRFPYCEKTIHVRNNSFLGSSNESIANILVKMSSLSPSVLEMEFCPTMDMGVAIFVFFAIAGNYVAGLNLFGNIFMNYSR